MRVGACRANGRVAVVLIYVNAHFSNLRILWWGIVKVNAFFSIHPLFYLAVYYMTFRKRFTVSWYVSSGVYYCCCYCTALSLCPHCAALYCLVLRCVPLCYVALCWVPLYCFKMGVCVCVHAAVSACVGSKCVCAYASAYMHECVYVCVPQDETEGTTNEVTAVSHYHRPDTKLTSDLCLLSVLFRG